MKNQRMKTERKFRLTKILLLMVMVAALVASFSIVASAANGGGTIAVEKIEIDGLTRDNGFWTKTYDGKDVIDVSKVHATVKADSIAAGDDVTLKVESAKFDNKNAGEATYITVTFKLEGAQADAYSAPAPMQLPAKILPVELSWKADTNATASATYDPASNRYTNLTVGGSYTLDTTKVVAGEKIELDSVGKVSVEAVAVTGSNPIKAFAAATLKAGNSTTKVSNYTVASLPVNVSVNPIEIVKIEWDKPGYSFTWGDAGITGITAIGKDAAGNEYPLAVILAETDYSLSEAASKGLYGQVKVSETSTRYTVTVKVTNANHVIASSTVDKTREVAIARKYYTVTLDDRTVPAELQISNTGLNPILQKLAVAGTDIPTALLADVKYAYTDAAGKVLTTAGASDAGVYTVTATLPGPTEGATFCNYGFVNAAGETVTELTATLTIERRFIVLGTEDMPYQMFVMGKDTLTPGVTASLAIPTDISRSALRGFHIHQEYTLTLGGLADGETVSVVIPVSDRFFANENASPITAADLYVYDAATGTMTSANGTYTVTLSEDSSYYTVEGFSDGEITFVIAPAYQAPFWLTAPGIALIILLVLAILVILFFIGLKLRQIERSGKNPVMVIDTEGEVPEVVPVVIPDKIEDADACLEESIDELAAALAEEVEAESEGEADVDAEEAVAESMEQLLAEAAEIELDTEEENEASEADETLDAMAAETAAELQETVAAESSETEVDEELVKASVAEAMEENFNESADSTDAIVLLADVEEESDELDPEAFRLVVDAIVSDAMANTMVLGDVLAEEATEEVVEETAEEVVEETAEEVVEETAEEVVEETAEEVVEETAEEVVEETAEEVVEETAEEVVEETAEEAVEASEEEVNVCAIVADSVAEAFEILAADGVEAKAVEGTTKDTITEAVSVAAAENAPETWSEELTEEVKVAVVEELAARLLVEEAVEAVAEVAEPVEESEDDDNDNDNDNDEDENDSFGGFGSMDLEYIDVIAEAERYAEMLAQEARGEVQLVTRYRRSYQSRLVQSQGNVQDYYSVLKNLLLSYKGVKNRISWNYESFNLGRTQLAKFNAKTRTLYVYIALDPAELADTKYGIVDVSSKKKYAAVPVLMKVKGDRKFKYTVELITRLCEEQLQLPKKKVFEEVDYHTEHMTTEDLVTEGLVKKLVAAIPVELLNRPAEEENDVTMVPAEETPVETPVEEVPVEEAPAEEALAVEAPAEEAPDETV